MIIITETKNGSAYPHVVYACNDKANFVERINAFACQHRSDKAGEIQTAEQAIEFLNERYAQRTEIITQADYYKGSSSKVDAVAKEIGWLVEEDSEEGNP